MVEEFNKAALAKETHPGLKAPTSDEFISTLGRVTWLMGLCDTHRKMRVSDIEAAIQAPLMFKQLRVFLKGKQPVAALTWAYASADVVQRVKNGNIKLALNEWRSGPEIIVVRCISPFAESDIFIDKFNSEVKALQKKH
jgi:hemolysin-activating ACP:hemolysin acyltransferase